MEEYSSEADEDDGSYLCTSEQMITEKEESVFN
jgi:hypothetical protein